MHRAAAGLQKFDKIFGKPARLILSCFALSSPLSPALIRSKAPSVHRRPVEMIRSRARQRARRKTRTGGVNGDIREFARVARGLPRVRLYSVRPGLVRTSGSRNAAFTRHRGPDQEIRRTVRATHGNA